MKWHPAPAHGGIAPTAPPPTGSLGAGGRRGADERCGSDHDLRHPPGTGPGDHVGIDVGDDGAGVPTTLASGAFEPFVTDISIPGGVDGVRLPPVGLPIWLGHHAS